LLENIYSAAKKSTRPKDSFYVALEKGIAPNYLKANTQNRDIELARQRITTLLNEKKCRRSTLMKGLRIT